MTHLLIRLIVLVFYCYQNRQQKKQSVSDHKHERRAKESTVAVGLLPSESNRKTGNKRTRCKEEEKSVSDDDSDKANKQVRCHHSHMHSALGK